MIDCGTGDIIALQLEGTDQWREARVVPRDVAVPGISEALDLAEESMADRVALLSALEELKRQGLVEQRKKQVRGMNGRRNAYFLTDRGRRHVERLRENLAGETVVVRNGTEEEVLLEEVGEYLSEPALPRALSRLTDDGVLYLDDEIGESFVDREAESVLLESGLESAMEGAPHQVLVSGEAGIGKTTLVTDELGDRAREEDVPVLLGKCQRDTAEPYAPFRSALAGLDLKEDPFDREGLDPEDAESYAAERTAMFESVVETIADAAARRPLLLVVDDLHLADEPTVALFDHLAGRIDGTVMLVGTCRPPDEDSDHPIGALLERWECTDQRLRIDLDRFDRRDTRRLIQWVTDHPTIPDSFVDLVYDRTGGNPLFVKESVAQMREEGTVDPEHGIFPDDPGEIPLLDRIEEAVELRLSVLDDDSRNVLEVGGLVGETVRFDVLSETVDMEEAELREHVDVLVDSHVWERDGEEFQFVSGLVRETVVEGIEEDRRGHLHERIARAVEASDTGGRDQHATIAHHYHEAGRYETAVDHYREAGDRATEVYAHEVALSNYQAALDLLRQRVDRAGDDEAVVGVLKDIAEVNYLLGKYEEADRYYEYVTDRTEDPEELRRIYRIRADMASTQGDFERELRLAKEGLNVAGEDDTLETCLLLGRLGAGYDHNQRLDDAEEAYERCLAVAERIDDPHGLAAAYLDFGALDMRREEVDEETVDMLEDAVDAAERADDDRTLARALNNLAMSHVELGQIAAAEETYNRCLAVQEAIGDRMALCSSLRNLASIYVEKNDYDRALDTYHRALDTAKQVQNHNVIALVAQEISGIHRQFGEMDLGEQFLAESLEHTRRLRDPERLASVLVYMIDLHLDRGDPEAAEDLVAELREHLDAVTNPDVRSLARSLLGELALLEDDPDAALEQFEAGWDVEGAGPHSALYNLYGMIDVAERRGDADTARETADTAVEVGEQVDSDWIEASVSVHHGVALRLSGDYEAVVDGVETGLEIYRAEGTVSKVGEVHALVELAKTYDESGDDARATEYAQNAREIATETGIGRYDDELDELLAPGAGS